MKRRVRLLWRYVSAGVWSDRRNTLWIKVMKTMNLSIRSFMNSDIQSQACAMTFRTTLAIVPALAMLFAFGRGFGMQSLIEHELYSIFNSQQEAISRMLAFVDSYLNQAGEGVFVGIGILFLLWTLISLVSSVEYSFNSIWGVKTGRSIWRKATDYTAMLLILPVLMICAGGLSMVFSSTLRSIFDLDYLTPVVSASLEVASWVLTWLFFTAVYMLVPNVKVKFTNALIAGIVAGTGFLLLQWIFVTGQMYVAKYNAIYGSVSFVPLMLIWMQLAWVITLSGAVLCYSSQNIFEFDFKDDVDRISARYGEKVIMAVATICIKRFASGLAPLTERDIVVGYHLPPRLANSAFDSLVDVGVLSKVVVDEKKEVFGYQPAMDIDLITVGMLLERLETAGRHDFIPAFDAMFPGVVEIYDGLKLRIGEYSSSKKLVDLSVESFEIASHMTV